MKKEKTSVWDALHIKTSTFNMQGIFISRIGVVVDEITFDKFAQPPEGHARAREKRETFGGDPGRNTSPFHFTSFMLYVW